MNNENNNYGFLVNQNIKLHRKWFKEATKTLGIKTIYRAPRKSKEFDKYGDLDTNYCEPITTFVFFQEHPDQKTLKKMGWVAELQEGSSIIHVPYDLPDLQVGALFIIPSGIDQAIGRAFRVISMQNIMIYPASISCEIAPEYEDTMQRTETRDFTQTNFNVLLDNEEDD